MNMIVIGEKQISKWTQFWCKHAWRREWYGVKVMWKYNSRFSTKMPVITDGRICTKCKKYERVALT